MIIKYTKERIKNIDFILFSSMIFLLGIITGTYYIITHGTFRNIWMSYATGILVPIGLIILEYILKLKLSPVILILALINISGGTILGPIFDWFVKYPYFDDLLHGISGTFVFLIGVSIGEKWLDNTKDYFRTKTICFGTLISTFVMVIWEMYEYFCSTVLKLDMQDDEIVTHIGSTFLSNSNNWVFHLYDITQTRIYYENGKEYIIDGGYLDIGCWDTLRDLAIGLGGILLGILLVLLINKILPKMKYLILPKNIDLK